VDEATTEILFAIENTLLEVLADVKAIQHVLDEKGITDPQSLQQLHASAREKLDQLPEWKKVQSLLGRNGAKGGTALAEPARPLSSVKNEPGGLKSLVRSLKGETEAVAIRQALEATGWNRKASARRLKISYKAILNRIRQHGLEKQKTFSS
jgi:DNA-binding NtrC family response regulator